ncbi:LpxL/LpxP family Kdo(2)-lipid IV(A) lauroyl/palmitoleoyl acyltransferase [Blochmannia endosymbiont of Polyrhachis (Hedomyrma) turneri]|nr:LpxL/LpxP family Kdo(2)-lipid IV(A) lauroyl/palmitoleoyl acyltransferase [Blochmannia endosymbiont of Polyrhachis (Hedomyrma) turneri]AKC59975.1 Lipid A biosynthesis lauroyl acyltransferase [Blochmannia endosymbiont of Polyrhachis (Hedomyrma) turneri]
MTKLPKFNCNLLHPKYWCIWLGIILLYLIVVLLPYHAIHYCGIKLGRTVQWFISRRIKIIRQNLQLCFPNLTKTELEHLVKKNCESIGMGIFETGMAWFWSDTRIKRWFTIKGLKYIIQAKKENKGVLLIGMHFLTLELGARIFGILHPGIGVYRPNNNLLIDWLQTWGRLRSNKSMLHRSDIKGIVKALKNGEIIWYAPDHDYGYKNSIFVPLFAVPHAATTIGTYKIAKITKPAIIPFMPYRLPNASGYELLILPDEKTIPLNQDIETVITYINKKIIEKLILTAPDQYMWLHRRFKTRPHGDPPLY